MPDHDGLGDCRSREVFHITPSCDVGYSADMCADSGRYAIGGVTGGILKNSMFMRPTFAISSAVALIFGMGLRGACVPGVIAAIIPITWNVPISSIVATL